MNTILTIFLSILGHWLTDADHLPAFSYDAPLPFECKTPDGKTPSFPNYWSSYWSASDNVCPSITGPYEGLPDQSWNYFEIPVYCAHPHAWMLYGYYKLKK